MSFGKMNTFIDIVAPRPTKDKDGFSTRADEVLASVRAYKEDRYGNKKWANMAAFSTATALFRFRKIPALEVTPAMVVVCGTGRYRITSVEDVRGRGMYVEVYAEKVEGSQHG